MGRRRITKGAEGRATLMKAGEYTNADDADARAADADDNRAADAVATLVAPRPAVPPATNDPG